MMKYKVGAKVKIRSWDSMEKKYGLDKFGDIKGQAFIFTKLRKIYCNTIVTIEKVHLNRYDIKEDVWNWTDDMIDHDATRIISIIYRLELLKTLTINQYNHIYIDNCIRNLKSNNPAFDEIAAAFFNRMFRKIKNR